MKRLLGVAAVLLSLALGSAPGEAEACYGRVRGAVRAVVGAPLRLVRSVRERRASHVRRHHTDCRCPTCPAR